MKPPFLFFAVILLSFGGRVRSAPLGSAFTYHGVLASGGSAAGGTFNFEFRLYDAPLNGNTTGPVVANSLGVTNGLFAVDLDFGAAAFDGNARWLEIRVQGAGDPGFTTLAPRTQVRPSPYALLASTVLDGAITSSKIANGAVGSAQLANGAVSSSNIANGSITAAQLASGAAFSNLYAGGQSGVAGGGIVLSENANNINLVNAGYVRIGRVDLVAEDWANNAPGPPATGLLAADRTDHSAVWTGSEMIIWGGNNGTYRNDGLRYNPATDTWTPTSKVNAPSARSLHSAVWTGTEMIVWGGPDNRGGRYNPTTDSWTPTSRLNAPSARRYHLAAWTGSLMLIWGGTDPNSDPDHPTRLRTGGRYNPSTDTWTDITTSGAPSARAGVSFVWTGARLLAWDGDGNGDGARYNPSTDTWTPISTVGAPEPRSFAPAVWTGTEMLVWGGFRYQNTPPYELRTGGRYNASTDTWSSITTNGAPSERALNTAVWGGGRMIVWGGAQFFSGLFGSTQIRYTPGGGRYDPVTDNWAGVTTNGAPEPRDGHTAVWTGSRMNIFGGGSTGIFDDGWRYNVTNNTWAATSTAPGTGESSERKGATAIWTGSELIVWGGENSGLNFRSGGRYDPVLDSWTKTRLAGAPSGRINHTAVWSGTEMIVWGGVDESETATGARYNPALNDWTRMNVTNAPSARQNHTAVWTGNEMIVWGGVSNIFLNGYGDLPNELSSGGRYNPLTDTWTPVSLDINRPSAREAHACVWTGSEMIIWGGRRSLFAIPSPTKTHYGNGARYNPASDTWTALPQSNAPTPRGNMGAVWSGTEFIVWAGGNFDGAGGGANQSTGGRYNPASNTWTATSTNAAPSARNSPDAFWDGTHVIFWAGLAGGSGIPNGGRYDPLADSWAPIPSGGVYNSGHAAAWTGLQMLVVGGVDSVGTYHNTHSAYTPPRTTYLYMKP
jgi:N-acetylneuraminic acid mutarotase